MLVQPPRHPLAVESVVVIVVLQSLNIPLLKVFGVDLLNTQILGSRHPIRLGDAAPVGRVAAVAAIFLGWEIEIALA